MHGNVEAAVHATRVPADRHRAGGRAMVGVARETLVTATFGRGVYMTPEGTCQCIGVSITGPSERMRSSKLPLRTGIPTATAITCGDGHARVATRPDRATARPVSFGDSARHPIIPWLVLSAPKTHGQGICRPRDLGKTEQRAIARSGTRRARGHRRRPSG